MNIKWVNVGIRYEMGEWGLRDQLKQINKAVVNYII